MWVGRFLLLEGVALWRLRHLNIMPRKRKHKLVPVDPSYELLKFLAGDPVILAASVEQQCKRWWAKALEIATRKDKK